MGSIIMSVYKGPSKLITTTREKQNKRDDSSGSKLIKDPQGEVLIIRLSKNFLSKRLCRDRGTLAPPFNSAIDASLVT